MAKKEESALPEIHRINGAITGTPLYSYDKQTYHTTPEDAASVYRRKQKFWAEMESSDASDQGKKRK